MIILSLLAIPMYVANSFAMVARGRKPIDGGGKWNDGRQILGRGKTIEGAVSGIVAGWLVALVPYFIYTQQIDLILSNYFVLAFLLAFGAVAGDIVASFFKRRIGVEPGHQVLFLDQLDFIAGGFLLGLIVYVPDIYEVLALVIVTMISHKIGNYIAYHTKIKKVPW